MDNIDKKRMEFWRWYFREFKNDCKNKFAEGPRAFRLSNQDVYDQMLYSLIHDCDLILTPTIVSYIYEHKNEEKGGYIYDNLFSGNHHETLSLLENFHSTTFTHIINRYRRFKLHFYKLTERLFNDWTELKQIFNLFEDDLLHKIRLTCGDEHFYGGQTSILYFGQEEKGFVYKPVGIEGDLLVRELKILLGKKGKKSVIIAKDGSGGTEGGYGYIGLHHYVGEVNNIAFAKELYKDFGRLLGWGKFFKIADGHSDNIIVSKDGVQWIDMEMIFYFGQKTTYEMHPLEETGLIYEAKPQNTHLGIITGIQGGVIPNLSLTVPIVCNDGTDDMYIRYFKTFISPGCYNRFSTEGTTYNPEDFVIEIQQGYREAIIELYDNKTKLLEYIEKFFQSRSIRCRYLAQATASYARFISLLQHTRASSKQDVLVKIRQERMKTFMDSEKGIQDFIIENELMDLVNGVIPYF